MLSLKRSNDRKVAADVTPSGNVKIANAFGLPSGKAFSCPGATSVCEAVCYAGKIEKVRKAVLAVMLHNWSLLQSATYGEMVELLSAMISEFDAECARKNGTRKFRIHWDGDFFSVDYARAWAEVMRRFPAIQFWAYTRTYSAGDMAVVECLAAVPNLSLYLSVDRENLEGAKAVRKAFPSVKWAFLGQTEESTREEMLSLFPRPGGICPENVKRIPLITPNGGACITCNLCVEGKSDIRFAIGKK